MKRFVVLSLLIVALIGLLMKPPALFTAAQGDQLAPDGVPGQSYFAPFNVAISLDGDVADWEGVPTVSLPGDAGPDAGRAGVTFAAASDGEFLYLLGQVYDDNIISGAHGTDYWNEDSLEFYINGTGDLTLGSYVEGTVQITIPALNATADEMVIAGVQGDTAGATLAATTTDYGWVVEVAVPLQNDIWDIHAEHGNVIGFQAHLNVASTANRDSKLMWSIYDTADQSYQNPSLFGQLVFFEVGREPDPSLGSGNDVTLAPEGTGSETEAADPVMLADFEHEIGFTQDENNNNIGFVPWGDMADNVVLELVPAEGDLAVPDQAEGNTVLSAAYDIAAYGGFTHVFNDGESWTTQDWSNHGALDFWLYGANSGGVIQVEIFDNRAPDATGDSAERWYYRITDDFDGWQHFSIPFADFQRRSDWQPGGAPDDGLGLTEVHGYAFGFPAGVGVHTNYIDDVRISGSPAALVTDASPTPVPTFAPPPIPEDYNFDAEWEIVWSDEFDAESGTPINADYWTCQIGGDGWGNAQLEHDTDRVENVAHDGAGNLVITAREETFEGNDYTSARCNTKDKAEFTYGRIEARINLPEGQGIWPAFWMLGADFPEIAWPNSGEIDIMEFVGKEPQTIYGTIHGPGYSGASGIGASRQFEDNVSDDYHVFSIEWEPSVIRWYVDGELFNTITPDALVGREWVFEHDFFLIINLAVGGYWPGNPDETTVFPQAMEIDWIRVYQRGEEAPQAEAAPAANLLVADFTDGISMAQDEHGNNIGFVPWGDTAENVVLDVVPAEDDLALEGAVNVLSASFDIATWGGFTHVLTDGESWTAQDWSGYDALDFWLYGANSGGVIQVEIFDNRAPDATSDSAERWFYRLTDDFEGWQHFSIPFAEFQRRSDWQPSGAPDDGLGLTEVHGYAFSFPAGVGAHIVYIAQVELTSTD